MTRRPFRKSPGRKSPPVNAHFDLNAALATTDNDPNLLRTLIELYFEQLPSLLAEIEGGLASKSAESVQRNAHSLKGAIGIFGQHPAKEAALNLEGLGRDGLWPEATLAWRNLQSLLVSVEQGLRDLEAKLLKVDEHAQPD